MRQIAARLGLVIGMLMASALPGHAESGFFDVIVDGVTHRIFFQAFTEQRISDLRDPVRFRFTEGVFVGLEVFDGTEPRIIKKVSVEMPPTPRFPAGAEIELPEGFNDPGDTGIDFFHLVGYPDAHLGTFEFVIKLTTGEKEKIRISPFPMTLQRLPDIQNVEFLDNTTKPVITWASLSLPLPPRSVNYRIKVVDPDTGIPVFVTNTFGAAPGDVQRLDLKAPPTGGAPVGWLGMELGKRYIIRVEGRLQGPIPFPFPVVTLPNPPPLAGPAAGQGRITRTMRLVEYTPLVP